MKRSTLLGGLGAGLLLAAGSVQAADCATQILTLQERLGDIPAVASQQGSGPGAKPAPRIVEANRTQVETATGIEQRHAGSNEPDSTVMPAPIGERDAAGGILVQRDTRATTPTGSAPDRVEPMDEDEIQARDAARDVAPSNLNTIEAAQALARAQAFYQAGDETACLKAIQKANEHLRQQ